MTVADWRIAAYVACNQLNRALCQAPSSNEDADIDRVRDFMDVLWLRMSPEERLRLRQALAEVGGES